MDIKKMANEVFPYGLPEIAEQWLDFAEHVAEAQHRKTWALAMECAAICAAEHEGNHRYMDDVAEAITLIPCPPIEATKDK